MTSILIDLRIDAPTGPVGTAGSLVATPSRIRIDGAVVTLPRAMTFLVAESGVTEIVLPATDATWYYKLDLYVGASLQVHRDVTLPDGAAIEWPDLVDVDPDTYEPVVEAETAWWVALGLLQDEVDGIEGGDGGVGPIGPQGPAGPTGPQGPVGPTGPQGIQGLTGPQGPAGPAGSGSTPTPTDLGVTTAGRLPYSASGTGWVVGGLSTNKSAIGDTVAVRNAAGTLTVSDATSANHAATKAQLDNAVGAIPAGPQGPVGPTGPQGATGPAGPAGADGATTWSALTGKPAVIAAGVSFVAAQEAIGIFQLDAGAPNPTSPPAGAVYFRG